MFKIAGRVLDFYDDPAFAKNLRAQALFGASLVPPERIHKVPDSGFAVKIATPYGEVRKWPIYNKTATAISGRYFCEVADDLPEDLYHTAGHLLKMAHVQYGLKLPSKLNEPFRRPESGLVEIGPDGHDEMPAPKGPEMAKLAQEMFLGEMGKMLPKERFEKANQIFELCKRAAAPIDSRIWDYVEKEKSGPWLREELKHRYLLVKEASNQTLAATFLHTIKEAKSAGLKKFASMLLTFDRLAGMDEKYDKGLRDPYLAVFGGLSMTKVGSKENDIRKWKLHSLAREGDQLRKIFRPEFITKFLNDPEGTLANADTLTKRLINSLMALIPYPPVGDVRRELLEQKSKSESPLVEKLVKVKRGMTGGECQHASRHEVTTPND